MPPDTDDSKTTTATETLLLPTTEPDQSVTDSVTQESVTTEQESTTVAEGINQQQRFGPRDLTALLKSLEKEIEAYEVLLAEEIEKRKKYRV